MIANATVADRLIVPEETAAAEIDEIVEAETIETNRAQISGPISRINPVERKALFEVARVIPTMQLRTTIFRFVVNRSEVTTALRRQSLSRFSRSY